jgi:serine/threonine protein kinase
MIDAEGHLVLIDYGLAKQDVSHPNGAISLVGTPDYSAPEILKTAVFRSCPLLPPPLSDSLLCLDSLENVERMRNGKSPRVPADEGAEYGSGICACSASHVSSPDMAWPRIGGVWGSWSTR